MRIRLAVEKCISLWIHHTGKRKHEILCSGKHFFAEFSCPIKHIVCLLYTLNIKVADIKDVFKLRMQMILHKYNVRSYNYM